MTQQFFMAGDGARLAYVDDGEGLPMLALSGLTRNMRDFDYVAPLLPRCRLIRMDYRGRGKSPWTGAASYTIPQEAQDVLALLDHLSLPKAAILGTSRGGLIGLLLAATAKDRLLGLCLNDIGPVIERQGLERIAAYVGVRPAVDTLDEMAKLLPLRAPGFEDVPQARWLEEAGRHFIATAEGLALPYDPSLGETVRAGLNAPPVDLWPWFDSCAGLPLALLRGAGTDLLSSETANEMRRRRPDMFFADIPKRGHVPFLDEPPSLDVLRRWISALNG